MLYMLASIYSIYFQLNIGVYYESLCPDSARFIVEQLQPLKRSPLGKYVDVTLVPFGKANVSILIDYIWYANVCLCHPSGRSFGFDLAHTTHIYRKYIFRCESLQYHLAFTFRQNT